MRPVKKILCAIDFQDHSERVAEYAAAVARAFGAGVLVVHVVSSIPVTHVIDVDAKGIAEDSMSDFVKQNFGDLQAEARIVLGDPAEQILSQVKEGGADMIVMGTMGRKGLPRLIFGSVAEEVVKSSPVPVLTLRPLE